MIKSGYLLIKQWSVYKYFYAVLHFSFEYFGTTTNKQFFIYKYLLYKTYIISLDIRFYFVSNSSISKLHAINLNLLYIDIHLYMGRYREIF